jgi:hypothetical protein
MMREATRRQRIDHGANAWIVRAARGVQNDASPLVQQRDRPFGNVGVRGRPLRVVHQGTRIDGHVDEAGLDGRMDLERSQFRGAARDREHPIDGRETVIFLSTLRRPFALAPPLGQGIFDARRTHHE